MQLDKLNIVNFKNIAAASVDFGSGINALVGSNGAGKTNVIEAVYYLSMCKSSLGLSDRGAIKHGEEFFVADGTYSDSLGKQHTALCSYSSKTAKKVIKFDGKEYERIADHVGRIPVVIVSPADAFLVSDAADERRRYLNSFISQLDAQYLQAIMRYNTILGQRNRLLKQPMGKPMQELLEALDTQLVANGNIVYAKRCETVEQLRPSLQHYYSILSDDSEQVSLSYSSELNSTSFEELLHNARQKDFINQFTTSGVHRDDLIMHIGDRPLKRYGSQGQQKSFLIALKLAQYEVVRQFRNEKPILLLDDLFDKLDARRVARLLQIVRSADFGQIFISDCNGEHLSKLLADGGTYNMYTVQDGEITQIVK